MNREQMLSSPEYQQLMLSVGELMDKAHKFVQDEEIDQAETLLEQADRKIHAFMFTDDKHYKYLANDHFMYGALVNLTRELTRTIAEL